MRLEDVNENLQVCPRLKGLRNMALSPCLLEKAQAVLGGKITFVQSLRRERKSCQVDYGRGSQSWAQRGRVRAPQRGQLRWGKDGGGGGLMSKAWSKSELGHLKIKQAEECDVTTLRMGGCGQSEREGQQCPLSVPWTMHFLLSCFVHSKVIINNL